MYKRVVLAIIIACSVGAMGAYSAVATAAAAARSNKVIITDILKSLNDALAAIQGNESKEAILGHIQSARQLSKEINKGSVGASADRASDAVVNASRSIKSGEIEAARDAINAAIKEYNDMAKKTL